MIGTSNRGFTVYDKIQINSYQQLLLNMEWESAKSSNALPIPKDVNDTNFKARN